MAQKTALALLLATAVMAASWAGASAQSGCTATLIGLVPCLSYIQGTTSTPSSSCCTQLASVVQSQPLCLCQILNGGGSAFGITVNQTQALALPSACNVKTPSPTLCNSVAGGPAASPAAAPPSAPPTPSNPPAAPSPPSSPSTPAPPATPSTPVPPSIPAPPSPATPSSPSTGEKSSAGRSDRMALSVTFALLFVAFYASNGLFF